MFCSNCGNQLNDNDVYCFRCGYRLENKSTQKVYRVESGVSNLGVMKQTDEMKNVINRDALLIYLERVRNLEIIKEEIEVAYNNELAKKNRLF